MSEPEYINQGTDPRLGGPVGHVLAFVQRTLSFHARTEPAHVMVKFPPFVSMSIPWVWRLLTKQPMRYATFRAGWRYDNNWPGYIFDVIIKLREDVVHYVVLLALLPVLVACGKKPPVVAPTVVKVVEVQEVKVPVPVKAEPPTELLAALKIPLPLFVAPTDPQASSALTPEGERLLRALVEELLGRLEAWRAWATAP